MILIYYLIAAILLFGMAKLLHESFNKGLSLSSRHQQGSRFAVASLMATVPLAITCMPPCGARLIAVAVSVVAWMLTYPVLFHISSRKSSPDYDNYMDTAAGYYFFGAMSALTIAGYATGSVGYIASGIILSLVEFGLLALCFAQIVYFAMYKKCIDNNGMILVEQTHVNEVIEFSRSYPPAASIATIIAVLGLCAACFAANFIPTHPQSSIVPLWLAAIEIVIAVALSIFIFRGKRSPFRRCGIVKLFLDVREFSHSNTDYKEYQARRLSTLSVTPQGKPWSKPSTIVMVIGESATRDFCSAFTPMKEDTTPWIRQMAEADPAHFMLFPNAYSCALYTVATLEKALTEFNQYNGKNFNEACTVVDIAHALGYRVHWYSNQGHLGAFDTRVTLVAETSDVAKWTKQELNRVQYDMTLLDFIDELNPEVNNLLVFHLKGSHFNFLNRYPQEYTVWGKPGVQDNVPNYMNSLRYTDTVLHAIFDRCREKLNMQAMLYFSDHGQISSQRRTPGFDGFNNVRIPMFLWVSDEYISKHPVPYNALQANHNRYFTNDLAYNLMCGLMDVKSNCYDESDSIASEKYRHTVETLLTDDGRMPLTDDPTTHRK